MFKVLQRQWRESLAELVRETRDHLLISSPFISREGTDFVSVNIASAFRVAGRLNILTNLSPLNVCRASTDAVALKSLTESVVQTTIWHLPRLHAKVYVADSNRAIVTSGNLTAGGLAYNYEYGVDIVEPRAVNNIRRDLLEYAELGASISHERLTAYSELAERLRQRFESQLASAARAARREFEKSLRHAEDELMRLRLAGGAVHTVFARTILYLLRRHGAQSTQSLHHAIAAIHPDLCDNTIDRVIDGKRFGKKWKHAVRTAQQQLKKKDLVELADGLWRLREPIRRA